MSRNTLTLEFYEAKLRIPGDRVNSKGDKVEGGKTFSRHYEANNYNSAKNHAQKLANRYKTKVVSVCKVQPDNIKGNIEIICADVITKIVPPLKKKDIILENRTLDSIIFNR